MFAADSKPFLDTLKCMTERPMANIMEQRCTKRSYGATLIEGATTKAILDYG